jgi:hypothetical protein
MALGSTQPLTEMSTRNLPEGKGRPARKTDNLTAICEPIVWRKCGRFTDPLRNSSLGIVSARTCLSSRYQVMHISSRDRYIATVPHVTICYNMINKNLCLYDGNTLIFICKHLKQNATLQAWAYIKFDSKECCEKLYRAVSSFS